MSERMKRSVLLCIVAFATMSFSYAQPKAAGGIFSFCGIGLTYEHDLNQNCFIEADLRAETSELFLNRTEYPGVSASLTSNFILKEYSSQNGNPIRIFAGSGITAGKARDLRKDSGYFFGLKGRAGLECNFERGISISVCLNPIFASHMVILGDHAEMKYYRNGLLNLIMPEVGIKHMF